MFLWFAFFLVIIGDSFVLGRRIKKKAPSGSRRPHQGPGLVRHQPGHHGPPLAVPQAQVGLGAEV